MRKKPGRKAKPRNRRVYVYLTEDEYIQLSERAKAESTTLTAILRLQFLASQNHMPPEAPRRRLATRTREQLAVSINSLAVEASRIGNNLNQLTRQANSALVPVAAAELARVLEQISTIQRAAVSYLEQAFD